MVEISSVVYGVTLIALAAFLAGVCLGRDGERRAWTSRADGGTPHHCDGEFYAVFRERTFLAQYRPRRISPPQGGSGTAPPAGKI